MPWTSSLTADSLLISRNPVMPSSVSESSSSNGLFFLIIVYAGLRRECFLVQLLVTGSPSGCALLLMAERSEHAVNYSGF